MKIHSVLKRAKKENIVTNPYPYIVINNVLDDDLYAQLEKEYPFETKIVGNSGFGNNIRYQISAVDGLREPWRLSPLWKEFIAYHTSKTFYRDIYTLFGDEISKRYPFLNEKSSTGVRFATNEDIQMDCQPGVNSPVNKKTSVKAAHLDHPAQLYGSLLYFRDDEDDSTGGELEVFGYKTDKFKYFGHRMIKNKYIEKVATVPYQKNTYVFFLNSIDSIHGVTPRSITSYQRRLVNIIGEHYGHGGKLFNIPMEKESMSHKLVRKLCEKTGNGKSSY